MRPAARKSRRTPPRTAYSLLRLFLAAVLINFSQPMFQGAVTASNTLSGVITHFQTIPDWPSWWHTFNVNPQDSVFEVITTTTLVLGYDVLAVAYIVRYTVLIVLAISAPLALPRFHALHPDAASHRCDR